MQKKIFLWIGIAVVVVMAAVIFITTSGTRPFRDMTADLVVSASVTLGPPDTTIRLTGEATQQLVSLLQEVVVNAYSPFVVIDEVGYRVEQKSCSKLQDFANQLR